MRKIHFGIKSSVPLTPERLRTIGASLPTGFRSDRDCFMQWQEPAAFGYTMHVYFVSDTEAPWKLFRTLEQRLSNSQTRLFDYIVTTDDFDHERDVVVYLPDGSCSRNAPPEVALAAARDTDAPMHALIGPVGRYSH